MKLDKVETQECPSCDKLMIKIKTGVVRPNGDLECQWWCGNGHTELCPDEQQPNPLMKLWLQVNEEKSKKNLKNL
jgi:hypothetical protein